MKIDSGIEGGLSPGERRVLDTICRNGPVARTEIAALTGFTGASITRLTKELENRGLVVDQVLREGQRGQPLRPLSLRGAAAFSVGVNFSHSYIETGLMDLAGRIVSIERRVLPGRTPSQIVATARASMEGQIAQAEIDMNLVVGAGFSVPGDFSAQSGYLNAHAYFPELKGRDLAAELARGMPVSVLIENDAASAAVGERVHGIGRQYDNFLFVHVGHGVGGGVVMDGRLYRGAHGNAGLIGLLFPNEQPRPSGQDLLETLRAAGFAVQDFSDLETLWPDASPPLAKWIKRAGRQLAEGIEIIARAFDPQAVILGGRLSPHLIEALQSEVEAYGFAQTRHLPAPPVLVSRLGSRAGVVGAASLPMFARFFGGGSMALAVSAEG